MRNVPAGFRHHPSPQFCHTLDIAQQQMDKYQSHAELVSQIEPGYRQIGTLGGGNHFIELQEDEKGMLGIMIHSGSRNFGKQICDHFDKIARALNEKWGWIVPDEWKLAYLLTDTHPGQDYIAWMQLAMDFAFENRSRMMASVKAILGKWFEKYNLPIEYTQEINCHHNYAALENHYGKSVWVHRKGANRAEKGELAVIPGAMGSYSYVVEGLGNPESYITVDAVMNDLKAMDVVLGKRNKKDVAEESRFAYKDIDRVMDNHKDLVKPIKKLRTVGAVKG